MKDEFEDIQRLIRLKRHEGPGEGFTEELLTKLHRRMREDMLKKSSMELLVERVRTQLESWLSPPQWAMAAAAVVVCAGGLWAYSLRYAQGAPVQATTPAPKAAPVVTIQQTKDTLVGEEPKSKATEPNGKAIPTSHSERDPK